jgi:hypothetical protein
LVYGWQFQDLGNGDGIFEPGEEVLMFVSVKNIGKGETIDTEVELSAKPGVDVIQGILDVHSIKPDATAEGVLRLRIVKEFPLSEAELSLAIRDWYETENGVPATRTLVEREVRLKVSTIPNKIEKAEGTITIASKGSAVLREGPSKDARIVALVRQGSTFATDSTSDNYFRIVLSKERRTWVSKAAVTPGGAAGSPTIDVVYYEPPAIKVKGPTVRKVKNDTTKIEGFASHPSYVRDIMIFAEDQKVLYAPGKAGTEKRIDFSADVPLKEGANHIIIIARHDDKIIGTETLFIRRDEKKK